MTATSRPLPRPGLPPPYPLVSPADPIDLWLAGNEGPAGGASRSDWRAIDPELLRRYPDQRPLCQALARHFGLPPEQVVLGAGADELLDRICRAFLAPGRELLLPVPAFPMLARYAALAGAAVVPVPWPEGPLPVAALAAALTPATAMVVLTSPQNPTGAAFGAAELAAVAAAAPGALLLVDLAYAEFADADLTPAALALPNAIAVRTFSKAYGLAGLRVGYALGPAELMAPLRSCGSPYPVAGPSLALARAALERGPDAAALARIATERRQLELLLRQLGARPRPSQANFVLAGFADAAAVAAALAARRIAVRAFPDDPWLAACLRITCPGDAAAFARLTAALADVLAPTGGGR